VMELNFCGQSICLVYETIYFLIRTIHHWLVRMTINLLFVEYCSNQYF